MVRGYSSVMIPLSLLSKILINLDGMADDDSLTAGLVSPGSSIGQWREGK